jgi:hypothetical protein
VTHTAYPGMLHSIVFGGIHLFPSMGKGPGDGVKNG